MKQFQNCCSAEEKMPLENPAKHPDMNRHGHGMNPKELADKWAQ